MNRQSTPSLIAQLALAMSLVLLIVVCRLVIDIPNFHPVMAVALFSGFMFSNRLMGLGSVLAGMLLSDVLIGFYQWQLAVVVYLALAAPIALGIWMQVRGYRGFQLGLGIAGTSVTAAVFFYLSTNLAIWTLTDWYASDLAVCLGMGLPFFKWTLFSNLLFSALLFGGHELVDRVRGRLVHQHPRKRQLVPVPVRRNSD